MTLPATVMDLHFKNKLAKDFSSAYPGWDACCFLYISLDLICLHANIVDSPHHLQSFTLC